MDIFNLKHVTHVTDNTLIYEVTSNKKLSKIYRNRFYSPLCAVLSILLAALRRVIGFTCG